MKRTRDFIEEFLPLVKAIACNYKNYGTPLDDLIQEGLLGLMEAKKRFKPEKGTKFSTYATYWIRKKILEILNRERKQLQDALSLNEQIKLKQDLERRSQESIRDTGNIINLLKNLPKLEAKILKLSFEEQRTLNEISNILGIRRERVRQLKQKALRRLKVNLNLTKSLYSINNGSV